MSWNRKKERLRNINGLGSDLTKSGKIDKIVSMESKAHVMLIATFQRKRRERIVRELI